MELRNYQQDCKRANLRAWKNGSRANLNIMPTGTGKTRVFAELVAIAVDRPNRRPAVVIAHRQELIKQAVRQLAHRLPGKIIDVEMGKQKARVTADVIVASVQTLANEGRLSWLKEPSLVVIDEAHHGEAVSYVRTLERFGLFHPNSRALCAGFTATPKPQKKSSPSSGSEASSKGIWDEEVFRYDLLTAIQDGWLCPIRADKVVTGIDITEVRTTAGDFNGDDLARTVDVAERAGLVVEKWKAQAKGRITIGFAVSVAHAQHVSEAFTEAGVRATYVSGAPHMAREEANRRIEAWRAGKFDVMLNCDLLTEGFDFPEISCVLMLRPTKSWVLYCQCIGRGTRPHPSKEDLYVLDFVDVTSKHDLMTCPVLAGLPSEFDMQGRDLSSMAARAQSLRDEGIDTDKAENAQQLETKVVPVSLFASSQLPPEVAAGSTYAWSKQGDDYYINAPIRRDDKGRPVAPVGVSLTNIANSIRLRRDGAGKWGVVVDGRVRGSAGTGDVPDFKPADTMVNLHMGFFSRQLKQVAAWRGGIVTPGQKRRLTMLGVPKKEQLKLDRGSASHIIEMGESGWRYG